MSDDTTKDRSPRSPSAPLEDAVKIVRKLFSQIRTASVTQENAVKAMGYKGINGAALGTLGTLSQYGLLDRTGGNVQVSQLAMRILHPTGSDEKAQAQTRATAIREAAMLPKVFQEDLKGFEEASEDVIANHLVHKKFMPDRAKVVAAVYTANRVFAGAEAPPGLPNNVEVVPEQGKITPPATIVTPQLNKALLPLNPTGKVLAIYKIPLGGCVAEVSFTGEVLTPKAFERLSNYVTIWKEIYEAEQAQFPRAAIWKNADHDKPVSIIGVMGEREGVRYFQTSEGTGVPETELTFA